jgi:hypothetical protein
MKIPMHFFTEIEKNPKFHMEAQKLWLAKVILSKKSNAGGISIPDFKLYYSIIWAIVTKTT